ncbi:unnamed protein product [Mytilus coruscus]|uniref:Uncharacterized protein n=1 Tax=Mytilus coruscus TaxID=42192 RepID=A0A6J8C619_MYTCO|nr:unnamed protein product [Mytilus coruscus]
MYGSLLVPVVLDKIPIYIRKSIAREHGRDNLILENLRKSITKEIDILEAGEGVTDSDRLYATAFFMGTQSHSHKSKFTDTRKKVHTRTCIFCSGEHYPTECTNVTDANIRNQIVKQKQLCFNCLRSHRVAACQSTKRCKKCNGMHHASICKDKEVIPGPINRNINQPPTSTVVVNDISIKNTAIDNEKGKFTAKLPWEHDHPDDTPSGMTVAKRRSENTSQWLVQSRSHMNPFEENLQGSNLLPRPPERKHPQLVDSRSQIDTGQELITHKENYRLVKLPCLPEETSMN